MSGEFYATTVEQVGFVDEPNGVSWLTGHSLALENQPLVHSPEDHGDGCNHYGVFPVSTAELMGAKGAALALGDYFIVKLNLAATQPSEVDPTIVKYAIPPTDNELGFK